MQAAVHERREVQEEIRSLQVQEGILRETVRATAEDKARLIGDIRATFCSHSKHEPKKTRGKLSH